MNPDGDKKRAKSSPGKNGGGSRPFKMGEQRRPGAKPPPKPKQYDARAFALEALLLFSAGKTVRVLDRFDEPDRGAALETRDRRFAHELIYGVLRHRLTLDCVITAYARIGLLELDPKCLEALRLGIYQLLYLDGIPAFAAINETVRLVAKEHAGVRSTVNAILRAVDRDSNRIDPRLDRGGSSLKKRLPISERRIVYFRRDTFCDPDENLALHLAQLYSHPPLLVARWLDRFPREVVEAMLAANNKKPRVTIRVNRTRTDRAALIERLRADRVLCGEGTRDDSILIGSPIADALRSPAFAEGWFYVQDETAMSVAPVVEPKPGERILDLCSAPGGKATHLHELSNGRAVVVAVDSDDGRVSKLKENVARLAMESIAVVTFDPLTPGAETLGSRPSELSLPFDAALLDVPCSNTGVLGRRPEARWRLTETAISELAEQGCRLFAFARSLVRPGGRIVYSTCSIEDEENSKNVERMLAAHPGTRLVREELTLPSASGVDGGYFARIEVD